MVGNSCKVGEGNTERADQHFIDADQRQTDNVEVVAVDALDQQTSAALDTVCTCFVHRVLRGNVRIDHIIGQHAETDLRRLHIHGKSAAVNGGNAGEDSTKEEILEWLGGLDLK